MSSLVPPPTYKNSSMWGEMVCACLYPLEGQNKALQSLHTILLEYYCLAPLAGRETSRLMCISQAYVGSYFNYCCRQGSIGIYRDF